MPQFASGEGNIFVGTLVFNFGYFAWYSLLVHRVNEGGKAIDKIQIRVTVLYRSPYLFYTARVQPFLCTR